MTLLMKSEYAAYRGVKPSAVSNWIAKGLVIFGNDPARPGKQLVDVAKTDILVNGSVDQTRGRPRSAEGAPVQAEAEADGAAPVAAAHRVPRVSGAEAVRMEEARERIIGRRIENEKALGRLVALAEVERRSAERGRMIRERVQSVVRTQSERLASEADPRMIVAILSAEFDALFARIADEIEAEAASEAAADAALAAVSGDEDADDAAEEAA